MSSDELDAALRALRTRFDGRSADAQRTEDFVVARLGERRQKRVKLGWFFPIAAVLAVSSAWASGEQLRAGWHWLTGSTHTTTVTANAPPVRRALPVPPVTATSAPTTPLVATAAPSAIARAKPVRAHSQNPAPDLPSDVDALYRDAHRLHFVEQSPERALPAWDRYLSAAPQGEFALEARYNRGVCLLRLGRSEQARAALEPFARGDYGPYRRAEAQALLAELERRAAQSLPSKSK